MSSNKRLSLLLMAAGTGSRYGGFKQIEGFGPNGETIMDYSLYDALNAGFENIVFVVSEEIKEAVQQMFLPKLKDRAEVHFEIQSLHRFLPNYIKTRDRRKPWGTAHAMLCGRPAINGPFAVINADDFYGREALRSLAAFLNKAPVNHYAMVGYALQNVLSPYGSVSRGIAESYDANGYLVALSELTKIAKENGKIISKDDKRDRELSPTLSASMNCWAFQPGILDLAKKMFRDFARANGDKADEEFYIPAVVSQLIKLNLGKVRVIDGGQNWLGVTYKEDKNDVTSKIRQLVESGVYPNKLW